MTGRRLAEGLRLAQRPATQPQPRTLARMLSAPSWPAVAPIVLLTLSNVFMTFAWYGHLKHKQSAL